MPFVHRNWELVLIDLNLGVAYAGAMRWNALFEDMEAQLAEAETLVFESEVSERSRADAASIGLADRLRGSLGGPIGVHLVSGSTFTGILSHVGAESLVVEEAAHQVLVPFAAVSHYGGIGRIAVGESSAVRSKVGLASALRGLARDRAPLTVLLAKGESGEQRLPGVIDRVGRDFIDLAVTPPGEARRASGILDVATVPFGALRALRSLRSGEL
jgi:hypothetical protein